MKRTNRNNSANTANSANNANSATDKGSMTMKRTNRNNSANTANSATDKGSMTMKRTNRNNSANTATATTNMQTIPTIDPSQFQALFTTFLAQQANMQANMQASEDKASEDKASEDKATREKAVPIFEMPNLKGDFKKSLYGAPLTQNAAAYFVEMRNLCSDVLCNLNESSLVKEIRSFADAIEKDASKSVVDFALDLLNRYEIPMQSMRVILQLVCPVMCVCCNESDIIARKGYALSRANALMGSACNESMYRVCREGKTPIPFKRVAYNFSALGLDFTPCDNVKECNFCAGDNDFTELVTLCQSWIDKCESKMQSQAITLH